LRTPFPVGHEQHNSRSLLWPTLWPLRNRTCFAANLPVGHEQHNIVTDWPTLATTLPVGHEQHNILLILLPLGESVLKRMVIAIGESPVRWIVQGFNARATTG